RSWHGLHFFCSMEFVATLANDIPISIQHLDHQIVVLAEVEDNLISSLENTLVDSTDRSPNLFLTFGTIYASRHKGITYHLPTCSRNLMF
ncbi:hypothetical protein DPQ33_19215, partial [Oceanidesulfovibrio indonesiensis]